MDKTGHRAVIQYIHIKGLTPKEIHVDNAPSYSKVKKWATGLKQGRDSLEVEPRQVSARWVPKLLGPDQKRLRCNMSMNNLAIFDADPQRFIRRFVTMDETLVHHFQPESKEQSKQWKHHGSPAPKKAKSASIFWDSEGVLLVDYLTKGQSFTGPYYATLMRQLREKINKKKNDVESCH
ncbi:uncharacterized protein LOC143019826 [Oratosquilla oratoria]|uniref:uncharacterized protein LOC143019826 n=1 Tax=Oratosquilla oratoria TaxID=337810 RepID=UPI003F76D833